MYVNWCLIFQDKCNVKHNAHSFSQYQPIINDFLKCRQSLQCLTLQKKVSWTRKAYKQKTFCKFFLKLCDTAPLSEWRNERVPPDTLRQMPTARHYTTEVKGFRSNPSQRSCLEKGHTEDICKPTFTAPHLRVCLQTYKWSAWLEQRALTSSVPKPSKPPCCPVCSLH